MQRLHLHWQPNGSFYSTDALSIWVEDEANRPKRGRSNRHPQRDMLHPLDIAPGYNRAISLPLPTGPDGPLPAPDLPIGLPPPAESWRIPALSLPPQPSWGLLTSLLNEPAPPPELILGRDALFWLAATGLALQVISSEEIKRGRLGQITDWSFLETPRYATRLAHLQAAMPLLCRQNPDDAGQPSTGNIAALFFAHDDRRNGRGLVPIALPR